MILHLFKELVDHETLLVDEGLDGMRRTVQECELTVVFDLELEAVVALVQHNNHALIKWCVETLI